CYRRFANAEFTYANPNTATQESTGKCVGYLQALHLVELRSDVAVLEDTLQLEESEHIAGWSAGDGRLFASISRGGYYYGGRGGIGIGPIAGDCCGCGGPSAQEPVKLLVLGGFDSGELEIGRLEVESGSSSNWWGWWGTPPIHAHGDKALLISNGDAAIVDAS